MSRNRGHGFTKNKSYENNTIYINKVFGPVGVIYLDFSKAFVTVSWHLIRYENTAQMMLL